MGWANDTRDALARGEVAVVRPLGGSMRGRIESGELVRIAPAPATEPIVAGDVVFVRWRQGYLLHLVKQVRGDRLLIGNNLGRINGWVGRDAVLGKLVGRGNVSIQ